MSRSVRTILLLAAIAMLAPLGTTLLAHHGWGEYRQPEASHAHRNNQGVGI